MNPVKNTYVKKPDYYVATSTGVGSDPNSLRDMGASRNVPYRYADITNDGHAREVTWKDLASQDATLRKINQQLATPHTGVRLQQYPDESEFRLKTVQNVDDEKTSDLCSEKKPLKRFHRSHKSV